MKTTTKLTLPFLLFCLYNCSTLKHTNLQAFKGTKSTITYSDSTCYARSIIVKDTLIYTANSNGKIYINNLKSTQNIELGKDLNLEELRDIHVTNNFIYGMQSGSTGKIVEFSTENKSRIIEYDFWKGVFLDGMDFYNKTGFLMGDPINDEFSLYLSRDDGKSWIPCEGKITAQKGEAGFAASGTNVQVLNDSTFIFISGGSASRFFKSTNYGKTWTNSIIPFNTGEGIGAFSVCFKDELSGIAVGGDYQKPLNFAKTSFYTLDGGMTWKESSSGIRGYRSCVYFKNDVYYSCGTNGIDYSLDGGIFWQPLADGNFFSITSDDENLYVTSPKSSITIFKLIK